MRVFDNLPLMLEEIRRDLAKSPKIVSSRVQATEGDRSVHEAMNYAYSVPNEAIPADAHKLVLVGVDNFDGWKGVAEWVAWLVIEAELRFQPLSVTSRLSEPAENRHPLLKGHIEGKHYGYTYRERMIGMLPSMESVLCKDLYSRRAYWPIFNDGDSFRASSMTRIPCTIGYHFMVRDVPGIGPQLHVTNLQRSCDFDSFFLSDLWFTSRVQVLLAERLDIACGMIHHHIISFHSFIDKEIY